MGIHIKRDVFLASFETSSTEKLTDHLVEAVRSYSKKTDCGGPRQRIIQLIKGTNMEHKILALHTSDRLLECQCEQLALIKICTTLFWAQRGTSLPTFHILVNKLFYKNS